MLWVIVLQQHLSIILLASSSTVITVSGVQFVFKQPGGDFELQHSGNSGGPSWSDNMLWLTPNPNITKAEAQNDAVGRVVYNQSLAHALFNQSSGQVVSFNTSFCFTIVTTSDYGYSGDGLAFSISPFLKLPEDSYGGSLGASSNYNNTSSSIPDRHLFAVEFDTFRNPVFSDPSSSHIGIDFNSLTSNSTFDSSDPKSDLYLYNNYTIFAWVEYIAHLHLTQVFASNSGQRPSQPLVNATQDLSDIFNPQQPLYAAISAASGAAVQGTALFNWSFESEEVKTPSSAPAPAPFSTSASSAPAPAPFSTSASPPLPTHSTLVLRLTLSLSGLVLVLAAACAAGLFLYKRRKQMTSSQRFPDMIEISPFTTGSVPRHSYSELQKATQGFSDKQKVGEGGFSSVYKGTLSTGDVVAVKRLKEGLRNMEVEFASEIQIISRIRHRNLLQLRGWAYEKGEALLAYQYMPNGSLESYLSGKNRRHPELLDGEKRFNILVGVAAALEYLHEGLGECVLHRDVKAANVLLTESFEAMLGDFGLARLITHNQAVTMTVAGTPGYVAPEVVYTGKATDKADVYSFGMLALEVACGRRALDIVGQSASRAPAHEESMRLLDWVWLLQQSGKLMDALDPACYPPAITQHLESTEVADGRCSGVGEILEEAQLVVHTSEPIGDHIKDWSDSQELKWRCVLHMALLCCTPWPEDRPTMRQVHQTLRESRVLTLPSTRPTYSRPITSSPYANFSISSSSSSSALGQSSSLSGAPTSSDRTLFSL